MQMTGCRIYLVAHALHVGTGLELSSFQQTFEALVLPEGCLARTDNDRAYIMAMDSSYLTSQGASYEAGVILKSFLKSMAAEGDMSNL